MVASQELERDGIALLCRNAIGGEGQVSTTGDLDDDVVGQDASSKTEESGNDGSETHISGKELVTTTEIGESRALLV